jgi:zinc protease
VAGNLLHLLDGPFNQADTLRNLIVEGGDHRDFDLLAGAVRDITPARVLELALKWLDPADMTEVIIG